MQPTSQNRIDAPMRSARVGASLRMDDPIGCLKYVSGARERALTRLGINTIRDLVLNAPMRYVDFTDVTPVASCVIGQKVNVMAKVDAVSMRVVRKRMRIIEASFVDDTGVIQAVWFNQPWVASSLEEGKRVLLQGTVEHRGGFKQMNSPTFMVLEDDSPTAGIRPIYRQTRGLTTAWIKRFVDEALSALDCPVDPLPVWVRVKRGLMSRHSALSAIHRPISTRQLDDAKKRLSYEELLMLQLHWIAERNERQQQGTPHVHVANGPAYATFLQNLPFQLTDDQAQALQAIVDDMCSPREMNRMLLGDVGTGKTIVAAGALAVVADSGSQGVLMAPTEVLARQYGQKIGELLDTIGVTWATLTASTPPDVRKQILAALQNGMLNVLFATHAVLEDDVCFANLSLVVIDEQHRFGVDQRQKLVDKGQSCDYLCMTATPIPRSLALTVYGNLDCSYIRQRPGGARDIETVVVDKRNRFAAFEDVRACVEAGQQAYIICPLIGEAGQRANAAYDTDEGNPVIVKSKDVTAPSDDAQQEQQDASGYRAPLEEEDFASLGEDLRAARAEAAYLQQQVFPHMRIGLLCGQMPAKEKAQVMEEFHAGNIDVLVSTTVVEVGVDVPNATLMVIEDAERFGLSQLHQLRGRVGRGQHPGKCVLLASTNTEIAAKRMQYISTTQDGFKLAELDLSLRHEGDVVGSRQHGLSALRFSNVVRDAQTIEQAREDAQIIISNDPLLQTPVNALLRHEVNAIYSQTKDNG